MSARLRRRDVLALLGASAAASLPWPLAAWAQQPAMRRVGILMNSTADDLEARAQIAAFRQALQQLGWIDGRNVQFDMRWGAGDAALTRQYAAELVALKPDLVLAAGGPVVLAVQRASRTIPIVFPQSIDPVGAGTISSLARPGGNVTGFLQFEYGLSGKWPELLKQVAPNVTRALVLRNPSNPAGIGQWAIIQAAASSLGIEVSPVNFHSADEIERGITAFARGPESGLIVPVSSIASLQRNLITAVAARHRLPAVYPYRYFVAAGGLVSYGPELVDQYRRAAGYVDRILKGEKPADLPVQAPTKYELVVNLKTAKALGIEVPPAVLVRADEVIE